MAATEYMIMSLIGSGLILIGISMLYGITGHLLMSNMKETVAELNANGQYTMPLTVVIVLMCVGLAIKSALFPFHSWLPDAYSYGTASSSAILSSLVSKSYIFLLLKIFYRVIGIDVIEMHHVGNLLFVLGVLGMILGSIRAMRQVDIRRMIAYSSVAQIGYIYMGIGIGTKTGMLAAIFHIISHAASKSMLFIAARGLSEVSDDSKLFEDLRRSGLPQCGSRCGICRWCVVNGRNPAVCRIYIQSVFCDGRLGSRFRENVGCNDRAGNQYDSQCGVFPAYSNDNLHPGTG